MIAMILITTATLVFSATDASIAKPRVIATTDINNGPGDPDDRQSLCHLLYYANELDIKGIIPERFSKTSAEACHIAFDKYEADYSNPKTRYREYGYPPPDYFRNVALKADQESAIQLIIDEAHRDDERPLYVLVWGTMTVIKDALIKAPEIADKIRLITIGTYLRGGLSGGNGTMRNWNGRDRQPVYDNFPDLWWVEIDWMFDAMFEGLVYKDKAIVGGPPFDLMNELARYGGALGEHIREVVSVPGFTWARYFRAGDTPSVLYVIDPDNDLDDPTKGSWAGRFYRPFPDTRPKYWTGIDGGNNWDYANPLNTWDNAPAVHRARRQTLLEKRQDMYKSFMAKVKDLYGYTSE